MAAEPNDPLESLRDQLDRTQEAARRLAREAAESAAAGPRRPPPGGWQVPREPGPAGGGELAALVALAEAVREAIPAELYDRLLAVVRELIALARALLDLALERLDSRRPPPPEVEDIPIS